jgi:hypothetical protein
MRTPTRTYLVHDRASGAFGKVRLIRAANRRQVVSYLQADDLLSAYTVRVVKKYEFQCHGAVTRLIESGLHTERVP